MDRLELTHQTRKRSKTQLKAPAFVIANLIINDRDEYLTYYKGFLPLLKKHGGSFFTFDDNIKHFEGSDHRPGRMVMFQFPTAVFAKEWHKGQE